MHKTLMQSQLSEAARRLLRDELDQLMVASTDQLLEMEPHYRAIGKKTLSDQMRKNISVTLLRVSGDAIPVELASAAYETGRLRAIQQVELPAVSRSFRIDLRILWEAFLRDAEKHRLASNGQYISELMRIWEAIEVNISEMTEGYLFTSEQLKQQDSELKIAAFQRLLTVGAGGNFVAVAKQLSTLSFDPNAPMVCLVSDLEETGYTTLSIIQSRLSSRGVTNYFGWAKESLVGIIQMPVHSPESLSPLLAELGDSRTAIAEVVHSEGLIDSVRNARVLMDAAQKPGLRFLNDHWVEAVAHAEPTLVDAMVQDAFGRFHELSEHVQEELLRVIDGFLTTNGSIAEIAAVTYRHRNTIRNRLAQIEELTGLQLTSPKDIAFLALSYPTLKRARAHQKL